MFLLPVEQVQYFKPIFEPDYNVGEHGVVNPLTGALYGAYGLTVIDARKRSNELQRLWDRQHTKGSAYNNKQKFAPLPEPDMVSEFPPEDTRGIIAIFLLPESLYIQSGVPYDLTIEVLLGNKTPVDVVINLEAVDLNYNSDTMLVFNQSSLFLPSGTESVAMLAVKILDNATGEKTIQVMGTTDTDLMVDSGECVMDIQPYNASPVFYQVDGPEFYTLNISDPVNLEFTTSNGMGEQEFWECDNPLFLQTHNLEFSDTGILSSTGVTGPPGTYQVTLFVEQTTSFGTKLYASKIFVISVA
jgi:hypothetical protein